MGYFNFYFIKKLLSKLFTKKTLIYIIIFLFIIILKSNVFAVQQTTEPVVEVEQELLNQQELYQNLFVYHCLYPYERQTDMWKYELKEIFDYIKSGYDFYTNYNNYNNSVQYNVRVYHKNDSTLSHEPYYNKVNDNNIDMLFSTFPNSIQFIHNYYPSTNTGATTKNLNHNLKIPYVIVGYKSPLLLEFIAYINGSGINNYSGLLNGINNSLDNINTVNEDILSALSDLSSSLSTIESNTSTNYSQQIGQISSKISDILNDNDTIISQNSQMIQQQETINNNLEQLSSDIKDVNDTLTDDTIESTASDLPSTDVADPTESGIDNIFQSIYNAFCVGQAQDIVFPIPFTDKNITLSPYYVSDMLNNNNAGWVYSLIQAFWGYLIGRFIISDISKKIDKIKSGNIENVENSNIKEEML